jgi:hypothetical protein
MLILEPPSSLDVVLVMHFGLEELDRYSEYVFYKGWYRSVVNMQRNV